MRRLCNYSIFLESLFQLFILGLMLAVMSGCSSGTQSTNSIKQDQAKAIITSSNSKNEYGYSLAIDTNQYINGEGIENESKTPGVNSENINDALKLVLPGEAIEFKEYLFPTIWHHDKNTLNDNLEQHGFGLNFVSPTPTPQRPTIPPRISIRPFGAPEETITTSIPDQPSINGTVTGQIQQPDNTGTERITDEEIVNIPPSYRSTVRVYGTRYGHVYIQYESWPEMLLEGNRADRTLDGTPIQTIGAQYRYINERTILYIFARTQGGHLFETYIQTRPRWRQVEFLSLYRENQPRQLYLDYNQFSGSRLSHQVDNTSVNTYILIESCTTNGVGCIYKLESDESYTLYTLPQPPKGIARTLNVNAITGFEHILFIGTNLGEIYQIVKGGDLQLFYFNKTYGPINFLNQISPTQLVAITDKFVYTCEADNIKPNCTIINSDSSFINNITGTSSYVDESGNGFLIAATESANYALELNESGTTSWNMLKIHNQIVPSDQKITKIARDYTHQGLSYIGTTNGDILVKNEIKNTFASLNPPTLQTGSTIDSMIIDLEGNLFVGTRDGLLFKYSFIQKSWNKLLYGLPSIRQLKIDKRSNVNRLYIGFSDGMVWSYENSKFQVLHGTMLTAGELTALDVDYLGNIYMGTNNVTILKMNADTKQWNTVFQAVGPDIQTYGSITALAVGKDNHVYAGTAGNGALFTSTDGSSNWNQLMTTFDLSPINGINVNYSGTVGISTFGGNFFTYDPSKAPMLFNSTNISGGIRIMDIVPNTI